MFWNLQCCIAQHLKIYIFLSIFLKKINSQYLFNGCKSRLVASNQTISGETQGGSFDQKKTKKKRDHFLKNRTFSKERQFFLLETFHIIQRLCWNQNSITKVWGEWMEGGWGIWFEFETILCLLKYNYGNRSHVVWFCNQDFC